MGTNPNQTGGGERYPCLFREIWCPVLTIPALVATLAVSPIIAPWEFTSYIWRHAFGWKRHVERSPALFHKVCRRVPCPIVGIPIVVGCTLFVLPIKHWDRVCTLTCDLMCSSSDDTTPPIVITAQAAQPPRPAPATKVTTITIDAASAAGKAPATRVAHASVTPVNDMQKVVGSRHEVLTFDDVGELQTESITTTAIFTAI